MIGYYAQIASILKAHGWTRKRTKGSHEIWSKNGVSVAVSITSKSRHTANGVMKQEAIDHKFE